mmetsp:Transcript_10268/g.27367  ORF Transcript_10268/g.27367 Transcript_10268/m.27367 type:complete len:253 (+) Transcript_10268:394-1152(+)
MSAMPSGVGTSWRPICRGRLSFGARCTISRRSLSHTATYLRSMMLAMCWLMDASVPIWCASISDTSSCSCRKPARSVMLGSTRTLLSSTRSPSDSVTSSTPSAPPARTSRNTHGIAAAYPTSSTTTWRCTSTTLRASSSRMPAAAAARASSRSARISVVMSRRRSSPMSDARKCRTTYSYRRHSTGFSSARCTQRVGVIGSWSPTRRPPPGTSLSRASRKPAVRPHTGCRACSRSTARASKPGAYALVSVRG